jgi:hypothetical protein
MYVPLLLLGDIIPDWAWVPELVIVSVGGAFV